MALPSAGNEMDLHHKPSDEVGKPACDVSMRLVPEVSRAVCNPKLDGPHLDRLSERIPRDWILRLGGSDARRQDCVDK